MLLYATLQTEARIRQLVWIHNTDLMEALRILCGFVNRLLAWPMLIEARLHLAINDSVSMQLTACSLPSSARDAAVMAVMSLMEIITCSRVCHSVDRSEKLSYSSASV